MAKNSDRYYCFGFFKSKALKSAVARVPPILWSANELEIANQFKPTRVDIQLKCRFWNLISIANTTKPKFKLRNLYDGICSYSHLFNNILARPEKVVWLLRPDPDCSAAMTVAQSSAIARLQEIASAPVMRKSGRIDVAAAKQLIDIVELLFAVEIRVRNR